MTAGSWPAIETVREALPVVMRRGMEHTTEPDPWHDALDLLEAICEAAEATVAKYSGPLLHHRLEILALRVALARAKAPAA